MALHKNRYQRVLKVMGKTFTGYVSSRRISALYNVEKTGGCPFCFPHGIETNNNQHFKDTKCWKRYRRTQYKGIVL